MIAFVGVVQVSLRSVMMLVHVNSVLLSIFLPSLSVLSLPFFISDFVNPIPCISSIRKQCSNLTIIPIIYVYKNARVGLVKIRIRDEN